MLELFEEKDFEEKTMTIKELSETLKCSRDLIEKTIKKEMPVIMAKGKTTRLNEKQVTAIKLLIQSDNNFRQVSEVKTDLEKKLLIKQGYDLLMEEVGNLQEENKQLKIEKYENKPKVEFYDRVTNTSETIDISATAQLLGVGRNNLFSILRDRKIFKEYPNQLKNTPYQTYIDRGYFKIIETETNGGLKLKTLVYQKGLDYIGKILNTDK